MSPKKADPHWFSFECDNFGCPRGPTGVVLDIRIDGETAPAVKCPLCGEPMHFGSYWPATEDGYGARGDNGLSEARVRRAVRAELDRRFESFPLGLDSAPGNG